MPQYKFREDELIEEIRSYVDSTYDQHYATDKYQATDIIIDSGHGTGFCLGNVIKYAKRYGRKGDSTEWRKDVMKILHYALIQLYVHDEQNKKPSNNPYQLDLNIGDTHVPTITISNSGTISVDGKYDWDNRSLDDVTPAEWDRVTKIYK